ncbi:MupA/Atu3671 family FMN-dependent luciferase-like monooxygenase [Shimia thalassica]|uniref:MupA/Atu3671 family FMN-dependent luciferase-like monooxygenase n=1 Tax=Shimia thalassica TaxID=1715693 RepID=UPI0024957D7D|nr:MupA/Atu3671 family FMN-dependent luciferase-like monooxygenase [Shimia thalassica]
MTTQIEMTAVLIGNESLLVQCAEIWRQSGHRIQAVVTRSQENAKWARDAGVTVISSDDDLGAALAGLDFDWLLSIANLDMLAQRVLDLPKRGAVNFHDGPLPSYAGLNAPVWARIYQEPKHGITWHMMAKGADRGDILVQRMFDISPSDTALTLNTKCYEAAIDSFPDLLDILSQDVPPSKPQDFQNRSYFGKSARPAAAARLDFRLDAQELVALVKALDHGDYWNPLSCPKVVAAGQVLCVSTAELAGPEVGHGLPGTVLSADTETLTLSCGRGAIILGGITDSAGHPVAPLRLVSVGNTLPSLERDATVELTNTMETVLKGESFWRNVLPAFHGARLPLISDASDLAEIRRLSMTLPDDLAPEDMVALVCLWADRSGVPAPFDIAFRNEAPRAKGYLNHWVPLRLPKETAHSLHDVKAHARNALGKISDKGTFACDLVLRDPGIQPLSTPDIALTFEDDVSHVDGAAVTIGFAGAGKASFSFDASRVPSSHAERLLERLVFLAAQWSAASPTDDVTTLNAMPQGEQDETLHLWNATEADFDAGFSMHKQFEKQCELTPDAIALVFENLSLTYRELNVRANQTARVLQAMHVTTGSLVGLYCRRSVELVVSALAILKAGAAYVPMDPAYPADRIAHFIRDSEADVIVTQNDLAHTLPESKAAQLLVDSDPRISAADATNLDADTSGADLAYVIYTSGSTGLPKGVMVSHQNVSNFFLGMDERVAHDPAGAWLAVTSLSFDISVLELFYSLARGFKLVLSGDESRTQISNGHVPTSEKGMEFSVYYWGNDDAPGPKKYELLLEGAKFADQNGFCAVWTPERHFHAFGGPYPNPSVTGAAVAAVTKNIGVRAGSCVAPLHHTARLAEEWAVIDNLTAGRAGLAIASGWQPDDFVLRPENTPPRNRDAMFEQMDELRRLWRGEPVEFPRKDGTMHPVMTQPRPVSKEIELWVTTAGNPETWKQAGRAGAHILTHLLGQSIDEVAEKIGLYHAELREAGYDPDNFKVTLMLHTFLAEDRETAREIAREPMKDYLRSAAGLIKQYAWAFPAFKKPEGVKNPFELDLGVLSEDELESILDFAFLRYFEDSGLFGTVQDALDRVEALKKIGVGEVACLIDYGIETPTVMQSLELVAEVLKRANTSGALAEDDFSIAAQILRHKVTHMQCTPSMARMLTMNDEARFALGQLEHLMVGGEALPGALVSELKTLTRAEILNMYGPTETTIWSTTAEAQITDGLVSIGKPIANTQIYILDEARSPVPVGVAGEMYIGGAGVTPGYWHREDLTADRFVEDSIAGTQGRLYRTGDLVRWRSDGTLEFLGRADHQVKLRGYRIELGEIEALLEAQAGIDQAVVMAREDTPGDTRLVAYLKGQGASGAEQLRSILQQALPEFMVPSHFVEIDTFPLTPNKKVDRKALPAPSAKDTNRAARVTQAAEPASGTGAKIAEIWSRVLGVQNIASGDNFFDLGGHSLLAVQAHREIRTVLEVPKLGITDIFRFPVLSDLARKVDELSGGASAAAATPINDTPPAEKASARSDAMSKRRAMRSRRRMRA